MISIVETFSSNHENLETGKWSFIVHLYKTK